MKKMLVMGLLIISMGLQAQKGGDHAFSKGGIDLNLGVGLGYVGAGRYNSFTPPLNLAVDFGITDNISVGGFVGFARARWDFIGYDSHQGNVYTYSYSYKYTYIMVGVRGAYHFGDIIGIDKLDVYGGGVAGNSFSTYSYSYTDPYQTRTDFYGKSSNYGGGIIVGAMAGGRWFFTEKFGVYAELGAGIHVSYGNVGMTFKLK